MTAGELAVELDRIPVECPVGEECKYMILFGIKYHQEMTRVSVLEVAAGRSWRETPTASRLAVDAGWDRVSLNVAI